MNEHDTHRDADRKAQLGANRVTVVFFVLLLLGILGGLMQLLGFFGAALRLFS